MWSNGPEACDYFVTGTLVVEAGLTIEPGTVVRAASGAQIRIAGGSLVAAGTTDARIVFEGLQPMPGYWLGLDLKTPRPSRLAHVDIRDGGAMLGAITVPALQTRDVRVALEHVRVSNSGGNGARLGPGTSLTRFEANAFMGNLGHGLSVDGDIVGALDPASDYLGGQRPNGQASIEVVGDLGRPATVRRDARWQPLGAPLALPSGLGIEASVLTMAGGIEAVFGRDALFNVARTGTLLVEGTAASPVVLRGSQAVPGYWDGLAYGGLDPARMSHLRITDAGGVQGPLFGAIHLASTRGSLTISASEIGNSAQWGIWCQPGTRLILGEGNRFSANAAGDLAADCTPAP